MPLQVVVAVGKVKFQTSLTSLSSLVTSQSVCPSLMQCGYIVTVLIISMTTNCQNSIDLVHGQPHVTVHTCTCI